MTLEISVIVRPFDPTRALSKKTLPARVFEAVDAFAAELASLPRLLVAYLAAHAARAGMS